MTNRRRYDTQVLVGEFQRDRRNAILLGLLGLGIMVFLVVFFTKMRGQEVPIVPADAVVPSAAPVIQPAPTPPVVVPPTTDAAPPTNVARPISTLVVALSRPGPLWIDGKLVGSKVHQHSATLAPGSHIVKTKFGKKVIQESVSAELGKHYRVTFDAKKKRSELVANVQKN